MHRFKSAILEKIQKLPKCPNLISTPIIDALLLCHVSWIIGIESGSKKIGSSQRYEVEKLAQYQWDIRYIGNAAIEAVE